MELNLNTKNFKNALNKVSIILGQEEIKLNNYIKLTAKSQTLNLQANNTDGGISVKISAKIQQEGSLVVSAKLIKNLVSKLDTNEISLKSTNTKLILNSEGTKAEMNIIESEIVEYPYPNDTQKISLNKELFCKALTNTIPFCNDKATNGLQGINIKLDHQNTKIEGFSANLGTVYEIPQENAEPAEIIISKKCANILLELSKSNNNDETICLEIKNNLIYYKDNETAYTGRILNVKYPQVEKLFNHNQTSKKTFNKQKLTKILERLNCFISPDSKVPIIMETNTNQLNISVKSELGESTETITYEGQEEEKIIALNCDYLLKILGRTTTETIDLYIDGPLRPALIMSENAKFVASPLRNTQVLEKYQAQLENTHKREKQAA